MLAAESSSVDEHLAASTPHRRGNSLSWKLKHLKHAEMLSVVPHANHLFKTVTYWLIKLTAGITFLSFCCTVVTLSALPVSDMLKCIFCTCVISWKSSCLGHKSVAAVLKAVALYTVVNMILMWFFNFLFLPYLSYRRHLSAATPCLCLVNSFYWRCFTLIASNDG